MASNSIENFNKNVLFAELSIEIIFNGRNKKNGIQRNSKIIFQQSFSHSKQFKGTRISLLFYCVILKPKKKFAWKYWRVSQFQSYSLKHCLQFVRDLSISIERYMTSDDDFWKVISTSLFLYIFIIIIMSFFLLIHVLYDFKRAFNVKITILARVCVCVCVYTVNR